MVSLEVRVGETYKGEREGTRVSEGNKWKTSRRERTRRTRSSDGAVGGSVSGRRSWRSRVRRVVIFGVRVGTEGLVDVRVLRRRVRSRTVAGVDGGRSGRIRHVL